MISRIVLVSTVGIGGFFAGSFIQKKRILQELESSDDPYVIVSGQKLKEKLNLISVTDIRLPIFRTVSAAQVIPASEKSVQPVGQSRISQIMKYGFPGLDNIRSFDDYVLSYDRRNKTAHWVFEHLTAASIAKNEKVDRAKCEFMVDESVHPYFRSLNTDYKRSGFDRGHLAAAGNHRLEQKHCDQTFYLSNMAPQVGTGFNRDSWNRLESYVRKLTRQFPNVYCCTGPLYLPKKEADGKNYVKYQVIGTSNVSVPTHFYKVILCETNNNKLELEVYVMPNQVIDNETPLKVFQVPLESVERAAGLLFFDKIQKNMLSKINGKNV